MEPYELFLITQPLINDYIPNPIKVVIRWHPLLRFAFNSIVRHGFNHNMEKPTTPEQEKKIADLLN